MKEEIVKLLNNEFQKEGKVFEEKYKNFDFENSTDLNKKIDFLYNYICLVNMELNTVAATTLGTLEKLSEVM